MEKEKLLKLAELLSDDEFEQIANSLGISAEGTEKTAEEEKLAEYELALALGEYTAEAFVSELDKIAALIEAEESETTDIEKIASAYDEYGRSLAWEYMKKLAQEMEEAEEEKSEEKEKKESKKEEEEEEEEKPEGEMSGKEKFLAMLKAKKEQAAAEKE